MNKSKRFRMGSARFARFARAPIQIRIRTNPKIANQVSSARFAKTTINEIQHAIKANLSSVYD